MRTYVRIPVVGPMERLDVGDGENELAILQGAVGGYIEGVPAQTGGVMFVDEEGQLKQRRVNVRATQLANQVIVGDAVLTGGYDTEGETKGVRRGVLNQLGVE